MWLSVHADVEVHDIGPVQMAWEPVKAWPAARPHIIEDSGHAGSGAVRQTTAAAVAQFRHG